ncbi:hypothetical protein MML48_4g00005555 [Holotrichia oblita]|uniref:Uncharacterized protein n=1 Tax=Holotrichia oblita TaxID=644536 RepID=A0ACB9T8Z2_HOLOL|nr:hypothetical protein MML48_4g00005555 [Holotrichia oblita]
MPKKNSGENTKAVAAKARKAAVKIANEVEKLKKYEDAHWQDNDKRILKKQQRKTEHENKKQVILDKKAEVRALLEKEIVSIVKDANSSIAPLKMTRAQIGNMANKKPNSVKMKTTHMTNGLQENLNRLTIQGDHARNVTEAIAILSDKAEVKDKHPEKRRKAAYTEFETRRLTELKLKNPTLRLSQMKQIIFKDWQKSPENPLNIMLNKGI